MVSRAERLDRVERLSEALRRETPIFEAVKMEFAPRFDVIVSLTYEATSNEDLIRESYRRADEARLKKA